MKRPYKIGIIVGLIIVVLLGLFFGRDWEEKRNVAQYLKERYGQEFIIKNVESHWRYLGSEKEIWTHVVSNDNPPIEFVVSRLDKQPGDYWETSIFFRREGYNDYLELKWIREASPLLQKVTERIFNRPVFFYSYIREPRSFRNKKLGSVPSFFSTLKKNPEVFQEKYGGKEIEVVFFYDINNAKTKECDLIYAFMQELMAMGIDRYNLTIDYFSPAYEAEARQNISKIGVRAFFMVENLNTELKEYKKSRQLKTTFEISPEELNKVKSPTDLLKYFKDISK